MALDDTATLVPDAGNFFFADEGTDIPADLSAPGVSWTNFGHTSLEDIFGITAEGGEKTVLGTLQKRALRTRYSDQTDTFNFVLQQFDESSLKFYFGSNSSIGTSGAVQVKSRRVPTTKAFLVVFTDGDTEFAFHAPKAEILRGDDLSIADTESFSGLPLAVTPVQYSTNDWTYQVTPIGA